MKKLIFIAICSITLFACKKSNEKIIVGDYIIFGHSYGFCMGEECVEMFMLTNSKLYEDTVDYGGEDYIELSAELYDEVKDIEEVIPAALLTQPDTTFGCPDCHDQGGVRLFIKNGELIQRWIFDNDLEAIPTYLHPLVNSIHEKITLINN